MGHTEDAANKALAPSYLATESIMGAACSERTWSCRTLCIDDVRRRKPVSFASARHDDVEAVFCYLYQLPLHGTRSVCRTGTTK
jgi:hypothetical protein